MQHLKQGGAIEYLAEQSKRLLEGCQLRASDGTTLYTPDGKGNYGALWTRDFCYMVHNAGDLIPIDQIAAGVRYLMRAVREDGAAPDRVNADGRALYIAGPDDHPLPARENLDNPMFLVLLVDAYLALAQGEHDAQELQRWVAILKRSLDWVPRSEAGLVWNDPQAPHSPYGFTDTIAKTGELLMESLLYWDASRRLARLLDDAAAAELRARAEQIEQSLQRLWDPSGAFFAASQDCRQFDIWGCAYALYTDFPLGEQRMPLLRFLAEHYEQYVFRGQIRHLLRGQYWQRFLAEFPRDTYQNGAYWATASGWVIHALSQIRPDLAQRMIDELLGDFRESGICECIGPGYRQLPDYVVSATNPLGALRRL